MQKVNVDRLWRDSASAGFELFQLEKHGKKPIHAKWQDRAFDSVAEVEAAIQAGRNIGVRPHSTSDWRLVIIDCDVKPAKKDGALSQGLLTLRRISSAIGVDFETWEPRVLTGPGYECLLDKELEDTGHHRGLHIYVRVPADTPVLKRNYKGLPGVEFLDGPKGYVVFVGSRIKAEADGAYRPAHECSYDLDPSTAEAFEAELFDWSDIPLLEVQAARKLSALLDQVSARPERTEKPEQVRAEPQGKPSADTFGIATDDELEKLLGWLDPDDYPTSGDWEPIAMAAHHATGGRASALELFLEWCLRAEGFDNEENAEKVTARWKSFGADDPNPRTARTLLDEAKNRGNLPNGFRFEAERAWVSGQNGDAEDTRPVIEITGDNRNEVQAKTAMVLFEKLGNTGIFRRGPELVEVSQIGEATLNAARKGQVADGFQLVTDKRGRECLEKEGIRIYPGSTLVSPMSDHGIVFEAGEHIRFQKFDARSGEWRPVNAPTHLGGLLKMRKLWPFYELKALRHTPGIDFQTGEVLDMPGIVPERGILSVFDPDDFPEIRNDLTQQEATALLDWVHQWLYDHFPFEDGKKGASSAVNLTGAICAVLRSLMDGGAPLHAYDAPQASTGKTKLAETHGILATGTVPAMANWSNDVKENGSRLGASLRRCPQVLIYDNLDGDKGDALQFSHLNTAITEPTVLLRILGYSEEVELPTLVHIEATGNNIRIVGDMVSRVLKCRIDSGMADPSGRKFPFCPLQRAKEYRGKIVSALLSVVASYIKAGCPCDAQLLNMRFGRDWRSVQGAVMWCGWDDPVKTLEAVRATDENRTNQLDAAEAWMAIFGDKWVTAKELWSLYETGCHEGGEEVGVDLIFECIAPNTTNLRAMSRSLGDGTRVVGGHTVKVDTSNPREKKYRLEPRN